MMLKWILKKQWCCSGLHCHSIRSVCLWDVHGLTCKLLIGHMKQSNKEAYHAQLHVNRYNKEPMDLSS